MLFNIVVGASLFAFCMGESSNPVSSVSFHRDDIPSSYNYNVVHLYNHENVKKDVNYHGDKYDNLPRQNPEVYQNIQYAPLSPKVQENYVTSYATVTTPAPIDISTIHTKVTKNINIEPLEYYPKEKYQNRQSVPVIPSGIQYVGGHNIIVDPKRNSIVYKNEPKSDYKNYALSNRNLYFTVKNNIPQSYLNDYSGQRYETTSSYNTVTESNKPAKFYVNVMEQYPDKPIKPIQVLSSLESAQIQPIFNQNVKVPRLHMNVARAYKIAHGHYKAPGSGYRKIYMNNPRHVPTIDTVSNQKQYLYQ